MEAKGPWWRGLTRYEWLVLIVCWLGWVFDIFDTALFNLVKIPMLTDILGGPEQYKALGPQIEGQIQTIFVIGWAIGGLVFGVLADRWGRTRVLIITILLYCLFTGLTALCQTWEQVAAVRFLTALGIGGEWAAGAALIAEVVPNRARAGAASILQTAAAFGPVLAALCTQYLAHLGWRGLFLVGIAPAVLTIAIRWGVKEPERWSQTEKPDSAVATVRGIFSEQPWRKNLIVAMVIGFVGVAGAGNLAFWLPNLTAQIKSTWEGAELAWRTSQVTYAQHIGTLLGVFLFPWLCNVWGRRRSLLTFFALGLVVPWLLLQGQLTFEALLWKAPLLSFVLIGLTSGFGLYFPELFPTRYRATGVGFAYNVARIAQAPLPWITGLLIASAPQNSVAFGVMVAGLVYAIGLVAVWFAPETKGQPLPE